MKKHISLLVAASTLVLAGCLVTSVYPFYTDKDVISDPLLAGKWANPREAGEYWLFEPGENKTYKLTYTTTKATNEMLATVFKLGDEKFLDLICTQISDDPQPPPIPSHFLFHILQSTPALGMVSMDYDWLTQTLTNSPGALRHHFVRTGEESDKHRLILTGDTQELQRFVLKHLKTKEAWTEALGLTREQPAEKPAAK